MTDLEIRDALINRDEVVTAEFFYKQCRPMFNSVIHKVFAYDVDYDECISEIYIYLMEDDARRLRQFEGRSTIFQWLKIVSIHYFIAKRRRVIENVSHEPLLDRSLRSNSHNEEVKNDARMDVETLLDEMANDRYVEVIERLILKDEEPEKVARSMGINVDNLYNVKKRAIAAITRIALEKL
uniref:sigma-70 family RNA polymerase sigma factor n=1 Tax=Alistipes sp. TaxID=1872444 RepID=UPI0040562E8C